MATVENLPGQREKSLFDRLLEEYGGLQGLLFLLPSLTLLLLIVIWPMWDNGLLLSFKDFTVAANEPNQWVGLENYRYWLVGEGASLLLFSVKMTILYELVVVPFDAVVAIAAALVMNESMPARPLWRGFMLAGYAAPPIAAGIVWATMEQGAAYGTVFHIMNDIFPIPSAGGLTANRPWAFWAVIIPKVWRDFGFMYVVVLAAVQSIPSSLYEMAKVDGAGPVQRFRYITLPHIRTVLVTVVMIRTVFTVGKMAIPWAVTKGGPVNYTMFLGVLIFKQGFVQWNLGRAAALGMLFAAFLIPLILIWVRTETSEYDGH